MINVNTITTILSKQKGREFSLKLIKKSNGEIIEIDKCVMTSDYFDNKTMNIKIIASGEIRKIRTISIIEFDGIETYA